MLIQLARITYIDRLWRRRMISSVQQRGDSGRNVLTSCITIACRTNTLYAFGAETSITLVSSQVQLTTAVFLFTNAVNDKSTVHGTGQLTLQLQAVPTNNRRPHLPVPLIQAQHYIKCPAHWSSIRTLLQHAVHIRRWAQRACNKGLSASGPARARAHCLFIPSHHGLSNFFVGLPLNEL